MPTLRGWTEESMSPQRSIQRGNITEVREVGRSRALWVTISKVTERSRRQGLRKVGKGEGLLWKRKHYAVGGSQ